MRLWHHNTSGSSNFHHLGMALTCLALAFADTDARAAQSLKVEVNPTSVTLGQPIRVRAILGDSGQTSATFRLIWPDGSQPASVQTQADSSNQWSTWTLLQESSLSNSQDPSGPAQLGREWVLVPFMDGSLPGPQVAVSYEDLKSSGGILISESTTITVGITRSETDENLRSIRPPVTVPLPTWIWVVAGSALALATLAVAWLAYSWYRKSRVNLGPPLTREEQLIRDLEDLQAQELPQARHFRTFFTRLTDLLRAYLDDRWNLPAPELTTHELRHLLADSNSPVPRQPMEKLLAILELADSVKFALGMPSVETCRLTLTDAQQIARDFAEERARQEAEAQLRLQASQSKSPGSIPARDSNTSGEEKAA